MVAGERQELQILATIKQRTTDSKSAGIKEAFQTVSNEGEDAACVRSRKRDF